MKTESCTPSNSVEIEEIVANSCTIDGTKPVAVPAVSMTVKLYDDSNHSVRVTLSRLAAIRLFHQLNNVLFALK